MKYSISDYYYACYNNLIDMCIDRGYTTSDNSNLEDLKLERQDFDAKYEKHIAVNILHWIYCLQK